MTTRDRAGTGEIGVPPERRLSPVLVALVREAFASDDLPEEPPATPELSERERLFLTWLWSAYRQAVRRDDDRRKALRFVLRSAHKLVTGHLLTLKRAELMLRSSRGGIRDPLVPRAPLTRRPGRRESRQRSVRRRSTRSSRSPPSRSDDDDEPLARRPS